ncbi:MAG: VanZ family protein [Methanophagales archaeon]|nr:VanZ family protein [Methanophagales archaeon]
MYALIIFYLSSLSAPPGAPGLGFLYGLVQVLEDLGLEPIMYPFYFAYRYPDKFAHLILYMVLGILLYQTLSSTRKVFLIKYAAPLSIAIGTLYGLTDEIHQSFVLYRSASTMDLFADFVGLLCAQLLILIYIGVKRWLGERRH